MRRIISSQDPYLSDRLIELINNLDSNLIDGFNFPSLKLSVYHINDYDVTLSIKQTFTSPQFNTFPRKLGERYSIGGRTESINNLQDYLESKLDVIFTIDLED